MILSTLYRSVTVIAFLALTLPRLFKSQSVLDGGALDALRSLEKGTQSGFFAKIVNTYLETSPALVEQLIACNATDDIARIVDVSHTLKSSSANIGAIELAHLCENIETMARSDDTVGYSEIINRVKTMFPAVCEELAYLVKSDKAA